MKGNDADDVTAQAEERGVTEADHGAVADQQVQTDGRHAVDCKAGEEADQVGFVQPVGQQRHAGEGRQARKVDDEAW
ncbi:hypothetical protein D3C72_2199080 [compost metagenome]